MFVGGAESMLVSLVNGFDRDTLTPVVLSLSSPGDLERRIDPAIRILHAPRAWKYDRSPETRIAQAIEAEDIQTVLTLGMFSYMFLRRALKARPSTRVFLWLHTTRPRTVKEFLHTAAYARLVRKGDTMVTVCENQARYLSKLYAIPRRKFLTIYNGVDNSRWTSAPPSFDREQFRADLGIPPGTPMIVQVAHFRREKRQDDAVRALAIVHQRSPLKPVLVFVGGGEERLRNGVRDLASGLGISASVRFCGPQADPLPFYWAADLFTLSSRSESFPMTVLEALATGLPAVMTDLGGAREVIEDGVNGAIARPADPHSLASAWRRVLDTPAAYDRQQIRENARQRFSLRRCVESYQHLLCPEGRTR